VWDTIFVSCWSQTSGGALFVNASLILIRACARFCTALKGTFICVPSESTGPHDISQTTVVHCGYNKEWSGNPRYQNGALTLGTSADPRCNHCNMSSNVVLQDQATTFQGRGCVIYATFVDKGINCTFLTIFNNSGNAIVDCGSPNPTHFMFVNVVENSASAGFGVVYASTYGMILTHCVFLRNSPWDLWRSSSSEQAPIILTNCVFDERQPSVAWMTSMYTIGPNVTMGMTTATYVIGHHSTSGCQALVADASNAFSESSSFQRSPWLTASQRRTACLSASGIGTSSGHLQFSAPKPLSLSISFISAEFAPTGRLPFTGKAVFSESFP
jgi:hypothetical protein